MTERDAEIARLEAARDEAYAQLAEVTSRVLAMSEAATSLVETHDAASAALALLDVAVRSVAARAGVVFLAHGEGAFSLIAAIGLDEAKQDEIGSSLPDLALCNLGPRTKAARSLRRGRARPAWVEWREDPSRDPAADASRISPCSSRSSSTAHGRGARARLPPPRRRCESDRLFLEHVADQGRWRSTALLFAQNQNPLEDLDALRVAAAESSPRRSTSTTC